MSDPVVNCILEVCCEPEPGEGLAAAATGAQAPSRRAIRALGRLIASETGGGDEAAAMAAARVVLTRFDLAERGTLLPLKQSIAAHARGPAFEG